MIWFNKSRPNNKVDLINLRLTNLLLLIKHLKS